RGSGPHSPRDQLRSRQGQPGGRRDAAAHGAPRRRARSGVIAATPQARPHTQGAQPMSALGQKQTSAHVRVMSALPPKADIDRARRDVRVRGQTGHSVEKATQQKRDIWFISFFASVFHFGATSLRKRSQILWPPESAPFPAAISSPRLG